MKQIVRISLLILVLLILAGTAQAQSQEPAGAEPLVLTDEQGEYPLGLHLEILEDPSGELTIDQVSSPEFDSQFAPSQAEVPNYGFTDSAYWVRLRLDNKSRQIDEWLLQVGFANMQFVDLYTPSPDGEGFAVKQTGSLRPVSSRDVLNPRIILELILPTQSQQTYYLRFKNGASMTLPLTLLTKDAFMVVSQQEQILDWLFFGALTGLLVYHLFLLFSLRETSYLYFVILLASLLITVVGYECFDVYLIPSLYTLKPLYFPLSFSLLIASMVLFSDEFLELNTRFPKFHRMIMVFLAGWGVLMLLTPFTSYHNLAVTMVTWALFSLITVLAAGIASWRQGFRSAWFFMLAWLGMIVSFILLMLVRLGITPSTVFSENLYYLGMIWMAVCWSIALADRINVLKAESENTNRDLRNSEHRLSQILEGLPIGVVLYGTDQKPHYGNRRTIEILSNPAQGIQPDLSTGRTLPDAAEYYSFRVSSSNQPYPLEDIPILRALKGEQSSVDDIEADLVDRRVPLEIWASPVRDEAGNVKSAVVAFQDISQRKQAEAELDEYRRNLELLVEKRTEELSATNEQLTIEAVERKLLELSLYQRIEWLSEINRIYQTITGVAGLAAAYQELFAKILELLGAELVFIARWEDQSEQLDIYYSTREGDFNPEKENIKALFNKDSLLRRDIELGKISMWSLEQAASLPAPLGEWFLELNLQSLILTPMIFRQSVTGVLGVAATQPLQDFIIQQGDLVERMALDLSILTQDAILLDQAIVLATVNERNRLARDLHDSVTQVLFSANLLAEVLPQIWRRDPEQGLQRLEKLQRLTRGALAEMRTLLLELRPTAVINTPLGELLAQLTEAVTSRSGLPFQLYIEQIPSLPEDVHTNIYRIAQEALNNVVKHAQAKQVTVSLSATPLPAASNRGAKHEVKLVIRDDGVGYTSGNGTPEHLGIGIMRERSAAIQADFSLDSRPGYGTRVTLIWPNQQETSNG